MIAGAAMGKEVIIDNVIPTHLESLTAKLREMGFHIETSDDQLLMLGGQKQINRRRKNACLPGIPD